MCVTVLFWFLVVRVMEWAEAKGRKSERTEVERLHHPHAMRV